MTGTHASRSKSFTGPVFIIGMPRSGTKLLRGLLNGHERIAIPLFETEFFPYWVEHWEEFSDLSQRECFSKFYSRMMRAPYFGYCKADGKLITEKEWYEQCETFTPAGIFEALVRHDSGVVKNSTTVWGDKSPSYMSSLELLKRHFPDARFVHIIRDVRDYCLSINHAWNKNMVRAAQRWSDGIRQARRVSQKFSGDYMEILYENLLDDPQKELKSVCAFLELQFEKSMLSMSRPSESVGAASGRKSILKSNRGKYKTIMSQKLQARIEAVAGNLLSSLGYPVMDASGGQRVSDFRMSCYRLLDGFNLFASNIRRIGIIGTLKHTYGASVFSRKK